MDPHARRRQDGEYSQAVSTDCRFIVGPDGEVTDRAWQGLGAEIGNRFRRFIWQPYRWHFLALVVVSALIGCAAAVVGYNESFEPEGTPGGWVLVGFGGGAIVG